MFILLIVLVLILIEMGKDIMEEGRNVYWRPRFWIHLTSILLIAFISTL